MAAEHLTPEAAIARIPDWDGLDVSYETLGGGITNHNYVVTVRGRPDLPWGGKYVMRIPGQGSDLFIDREVEPYGRADAVEAALDDQVAAVIVEPIQGEGGVHVPPPGYLRELSRLCRANGSLLIVDEVQTGFCRTGPLFATAAAGAEADLLTMAKGIAGGFPLGAFAMTEAVAGRLEAGDHGGTYCGNPLACAVAEAVIRHLIDEGIQAHVEELGAEALARMSSWSARFPAAVTGARGAGLLLLAELNGEETAAAVAAEALRRGVFVRQTQGTGIRVFPALTITRDELDEGLTVLEEAIAAVAG